MAALLYTLLFLSICSINSKAVEEQRYGKGFRPNRTPTHARLPKTSPRDAVGWIIGGEAADDAEFPYQVSMQYGKRHYCGASIISNNYILTAAHCVYGYDDFLDDRLVVGKTKLSSQGGTELEFGEVTIHPDYDDDTLDSDIAVIKLKQSLVYDDNIQPVALPARDNCKYLPEMTNVVVTGWGLTSGGGNVVDDLQKVTVQVANRQECDDDYGGEITDGMLCAGAKRKDSCQGDSGGPLVSSVDDAQYGIVSWGLGCARPTHYGVYTRVCQYREWLKTVTGV